MLLSASDTVEVPQVKEDAVTVNVFAALSVQFPPTGVMFVDPALRVVIVLPDTVATLVLELV